MSVSRRSPGTIPGRLLGIGALALAAVSALAARRTASLCKPRPSRALTPEATAGFQTTDNLILTVHLPGADKTRPADTLRVQLVDADGKVLADVEQQAQLGDAPTSHRFDLKNSGKSRPIR